MQSDNLVTDNVVTGSDIRWNGGGPAVVVGDQVVGSPCTGDTAVVYETGFVDFEPFQCGLVDTGTVSVAVRHVSEDWSVVRRWPCGPLDVD